MALLGGALASGWLVAAAAVVLTGIVVAGDRPIGVGVVGIAIGMYVVVELALGPPAWRAVPLVAVGVGLAGVLVWAAGEGPLGGGLLADAAGLLAATGLVAVALVAARGRTG